MGERAKWKITCLLLVFIATLIGAKVGRWEGRAEMKRWQDSYYAAHPVVKEVPATPTINGAQSWVVRAGEECIVISFDNNMHYEAMCKPAPAPAKKAKPAVTLHLKDFHCYHDPSCKSFLQYMEQQAKPAKAL